MVEELVGRRGVTNISTHNRNNEDCKKMTKATCAILKSYSSTYYRSTKTRRLSYWLKFMVQFSEGADQTNKYIPIKNPLPRAVAIEIQQVISF